MAEVIDKHGLVEYLRERARARLEARQVYWNSRPMSACEALRRADELSGSETSVRWYDNILVLPPDAHERLRALSIESG